MCTSYTPPDAIRLPRKFKVRLDVDPPWKTATYLDYLAPIITADSAGNRQALLASYGMLPKRHQVKDTGGAGKSKATHYSTMNARSETVGQRIAFSKAWRNAQLCLVPMSSFWEPNYEADEKKSVRWQIGMADGDDFAVAGLWRTWNEPDGQVSHSFTQLTINADHHPLMCRFHRRGDEKRSLVILPEAEWDLWLNCRDPEQARAFLQPYPAELMTACPDPLKPKPPKAPPAPEPSLF